MKCCNNKRNGRSCVSTSATFASSFVESGVHNLDPNLTINGITVDPTFRYIGGMADGTNKFYPWGYGETLSIAGPGTAPTLNQGSPLLGAHDDSVLFNGGKYYQASNTALADVGTEDFVFEFLFRASTGANIRLLDKRGAGAGWSALLDTSTNLQIFGSDGTNTVLLIEPLVNGAWYHVLVFADRSGSAICYINGIAGTAVSIAAVTTLAKDTALTIGALSTGGSAYTSNLAYFAMWKRSAWLDTHLQATVATERFQKLIGIYPQIAKGTATPTVATRTSAGYLDKVESDGTKKLYQVGASWLRCCSRNDANGVNVKGYLSEPAATNLALQSQNFGTTWTKTRLTTPSGSVSLPNGTYGTQNTLHEDATAASSHYLQSAAIAATDGTKYCFSLWGKAANRDWMLVQPYNSPGVTPQINFDVANGAVGVKTASVVGSGVEDWGNGWFRCWFTWTQDGTRNVYIQIYINEANNDSSFDGLDQDSVYVFGAQVEASVDYPSSYIPTTTATVTRTADALRYKGDDGNLGGVGSNKAGTVSFDMLLPNVDDASNRRLFFISDGGSANDRIQMNTLNAGDVPAITIVANTTTVTDNGGTTDIVDGVKHNLKYTWKINEPTTIFLDGVSEAVDLSVADIPDDLDDIDVAHNNAGNAGGLLANLKIYGKPT